MPYVKKENRAVILAGGPPTDAGELNFALTAVILRYLALNGRQYRTMNDIVGALESCKQEFYRRVVSPYEDHKVAVNGDIAGYGP